MNRKAKLEKALANYDSDSMFTVENYKGAQIENERLAPLHAVLLDAVEALEFYGNKNNWNRDVNGWRHDMIQTDLDDESLTDWNGRFSGKRGREALSKIDKVLGEM